MTERPPHNENADDWLHIYLLFAFKAMDAGEEPPAPGRVRRYVIEKARDGEAVIHG